MIGSYTQRSTSQATAYKDGQSPPLPHIQLVYLSKPVQPKHIVEDVANTGMHEHISNDRPRPADQHAKIIRQCKPLVYRGVESVLLSAPQDNVQRLYSQKHGNTDKDDPKDHTTHPKLMYDIVPETF